MKPQLSRGIESVSQIRPKAIALPENGLIHASPLRDRETLPLLIEPAHCDVELAEWAGSNRQFIQSVVLEHGAILFRNFLIRSVQQFEQVASAICLDLFGEYGDLPREGITGNIYSSTPYPADQPILFHNESSHLHRWPMKIFFFCVKAALQGGATPIVDCRKVYRMLAPDIRERFKTKKVMYVRNFVSGLDVSWQSFFGTTKPEEVEVRCNSSSVELEWNNNGGLKMRQVCEAVRRHPISGETMLFNQIQLYHPSFLAPSVRDSMLALFKTEEDLPRTVHYGDGTLIEQSVIDELSLVYGEAEVVFPWQEGDILLLDNMLTAHARRPYVGPRKIAVAMGELYHDPM